MFKFSYLKSANADYIDELFARYTQDPTSIDESWKYFFEGLELGIDIPAPEHENGNGHANGVANGHAAPAAVSSVDLSGEAKVAELILAYRERGRYLADINPLSAPATSHPSLELSYFGLSTADLTKTFQAGKLIGLGAAKLADIIARLKTTYCRTIAVELAHIESREARDWLTTQMEKNQNQPQLDVETRKMIYKRLTESESLERFLHTRYVAQKRFSVEGGESVIPALDSMIEASAQAGANEFVLGMAHRGRLNVLCNLFGKAPQYLFTEFEGTYKLDPAEGEGDVKYHKGYSADLTTRQGKKVHLSLAFNPSHLEFVNAVVEGTTRAKQDMLGDKKGTQVVPIVMHGDAAFAGQGVCYETLQMCHLEGYSTGGTLHIVINNQVGFTTSPKDSRSTPYSTDLARMLDSPIFHVNGDDPEAVWNISRLATEFRTKFGADVFIDLVCYRKHGHNEGDEPSFTQPLMYKKIKAHASTRELYGKSLAAAGVIGEADIQGVVDQVMEKLTAAQQITKKEAPYKHNSVFEGGEWKGLRQPSDKEIFVPAKTTVDEKTLKELSDKINKMPAGFQLHSKLSRFFEARSKAVQDGVGLDWGNAEALAYASLVNEGHNIRLSGQDAERGTFTHRHSVLNDFETGEQYTPLNHIRPNQGRYMVYNSHLSETGVLGFEYGYALAAPQTLTIWEAQFGDFANGAQVIIDQFIATSESKWQRMNGLVLLLPHGYEGQGPEHSSARLERFLNLCGRQNMQIVNLSTPAQIFHALRRQVKRDFRKPLVVMSPKSLLRLPQATSTLEDLTKRGFQEVIDDSSVKNPASINRVLLCSGKVYYELVNERTARKRDDVAIIRIEQFYPWPAEMLASILSKYTGAKDFVWTQEEPRNMGGWQFVFAQWMGGLGDFASKVGGRAVRYVGRDVASAPAVGSPKAHESQLKAFLEAAFSG